VRLEISRGRRGLVSGFFFLAMGIVFLAESMGAWNFEAFYVWPLALIAIGVSTFIDRAERHKVDEARNAQLAVAEERVRIARELHDIVAHGVSLMTVQVAAAGRVFEKSPGDARKALGAAEAAGRQSLVELRDIVTVLRSADASLEAAAGIDAPAHVNETAPLPGIHDIEALAKGMREAGMNLELTVEGDCEVPAATGLTTYRILQEALTNALRHAAESTVKARVECGSKKVEVNVSNDGEFSFDPPPKWGHGLVGMRERVASGGGKFNAGPLEGGQGWRVEATIPLRQL